MVDHLTVGFIKGAHGIRGEIFLLPLTDFPERFAPGSRLLLEENDRLRPLTVTESRVHNEGYLLKFEGFERRTAAESLKGHYLFIPIEEAGPLEEGEYYTHQLIGLRVRTVDDKDLGTVGEVVANPGQELLAIPTERGELLVPLVRAIVREVDLANGVILIDPPEGLLDL